MSDHTQRALLGSFPSGLAVDLVRQTLEAEEIPVLVRGNQTGIFGGAFQGLVMGGVEIMVPEPELSRARELVGLGDA